MQINALAPAALYIYKMEQVLNDQSNPQKWYQVEIWNQYLIWKKRT